MYIGSLIYTPTFKAAAPQKQNIPDEAEFLRTLRTGQGIPLKQVRQETGNTIFHEIVDANYTKLVSYMMARGTDFDEVKNMRNAKGQTPVDMAKSDEMRIMLKRMGCESGSNLASSPDASLDARTIAAKEFMTNPVMEKVTGKQTDTKIEKQSEDKTDKKPVSFFDAFEEVPDEGGDIKEEKSEAQEEATRNSNEVSKQNQIDLQGVQDFKILSITAADIQSINDLIGLSNVKNELITNVVAPLKDVSAKQKLNDNNINLPNGILFNGKSSVITILKALSNEIETPVIIMDNPQQFEQIITAVEARYKKSGKRTMILAQGFDRYFSQCTTCNDVNSNKFKNDLKGLKNKGGLFIATTDDKTKICGDFMQSGIIDKVIEVPLPDEQDRTEFFGRYFKNKDIFKNIANEEDISKIVMLTDNMTYSDMTRILDETARTAVASGKNADMEMLKKQFVDFSNETGRVPITEENRTAGYDTPEFHRIPIEKGEMMSLDELGGMPETKKRLRELYVEPMKNIDEMTKIFGNDAVPDGAIFYGEPGNGKTLTAKVLARELGLPYYETRLSDFATAYVHESGKAFKKLADQLDRKFKETGERSVWFLDEFDSTGASRNGNGFHDNELTDALLQEFTNPQERGFILIAATNNLENVDPALKRRGRLGNWIEFKNPNQTEREDTIKKILSKHDFTKEFVDDKALVTVVAKELDGFSMSSIANILKDAKRDFYLNKTDFRVAVRKALDVNMEREMGELCGKAGLKQHKYEEGSFKTLDELGGMSDVIQQLRENVIDSWDPEIRKKLLENKRAITGGFILEGPPGGGKTTVIETLAREMDIPLYKMDYNQEGNEYIHQVSKNVHEIFDRLALEAKVRKKPVMLFFDEAERFFPRNAARHQIEEVNTYKDLMNTAASKGIILSGATNHINEVNQEIIGNPRRMGTVIHCGNPNLQDRKDILGKLLSGLPIIKEDFTEKDIEDIALSTDGFSIGQLSDAVDKIIVQAIKRREDLTPEKVVNEFIMNIVPNHIDQQQDKEF